MFLCHKLTVGTVALSFTVTVSSLQGIGNVVTGMSEGVDEGVEAVVKRVAEQHLSECYLVVVTRQGRGSALTPMARSLWAVFYPFVWVAVSSVSAAARAPALLLRRLRVRDSSFTCRAFLLDLSRPDHSTDILEFLEDTNLYLWPETRVMGLGPPLPTLADVRVLLTHPALRNTAHALYLGLHTRKGTQDYPSSTRETHLTAKSCDPRRQQKQVREGGCAGLVEVFRRCLYCHAGEVEVRLAARWQGASDPPTQLFPDEFQNMAGHRFRIVSMDWYPFLSFQRHSNASATTVTPLDSLDYRMLTAVSRLLNFTYEMRVPWDNQWGMTQDDGNWTGTVGTLQHHKADFSMLLSYFPSRMAVVDYSRVYISEPLVIVTRKAGPLPQIFALVRPFTNVLWVAVGLASVAMGVVMWAMEWAWWRACGGSAEGQARRGLSGSLLTAWMILLEESVPYTPSSMTGQMLLGWWWAFCMLLTAAYRSALIAHLSVPDESSAINTLEDLLSQKGWTWGMEATYDVGYQWLKESTLPTQKQVYASLQVMTPEKHLSRVLQGHHAFLTWKYYIRSLIGAHYTNRLGYTPLHTSTQEYINYGGYGWGFRKGAPIRLSIDRVKQRLIEAGLTNHWINELIATANRAARAHKPSSTALPAQYSEEAGRGGLVVLGVGQLQGAFYLLALGVLVGLLLLAIEVLLGGRPRPHWTHTRSPKPRMTPSAPTPFPSPRPSVR